MKPTYEELETQVQELQAHAEFIKNKLQDITATPICCEKGYGACCGDPDFTWPEDVVSVLSKTPSQSLAALKAQWQAEAIRDRWMSEANKLRTQGAE